MQLVRAALVLAVCIIAAAAAGCIPIFETMQSSSSADRIEPIGNLCDSQAVVFTSSKSGLRLQKHKQFFEPNSVRIAAQSSLPD